MIIDSGVTLAFLNFNFYLFILFIFLSLYYSIFFNFLIFTLQFLYISISLIFLNKKMFNTLKKTLK